MRKAINSNDTSEWVLCARAIVDINAGEEICQSYTELYASRDVRKAYLRSNYFFDCNCERCTSASFIKRDMVMEALVCTAAGCKNGRLIPELYSSGEGSKELDTGRIWWVCSSCGLRVDDAEIRPKFDVLQKLIAQVNGIMIGKKGGECGVKRLLQAKKIYDRFFALADNFLHPFHTLLFKAHINYISVLDTLVSALQLQLQQIQHEQGLKRDDAPKGTKEMNQLVEWARQLYGHTVKASKAASFILPRHLPERAGLLRVEYKSLTLLAMFVSETKEKLELLNRAKECASKAKEIYRISRGDEDMESIAAEKKSKQRDKRRQRRKKRKEQLAGS